MQQVYDSSLKMYQSTPYSSRTVPATYNEELTSLYNSQYSSAYSSPYFKQPYPYSEAVDNSSTSSNNSSSPDNSLYSYTQNLNLNSPSSPAGYFPYTPSGNMTSSSPSSFPTYIPNSATANNLQFPLFASPLSNSTNYHGYFQHDYSYSNYSNILPINSSSDYSTPNQSITETCPINNNQNVNTSSDTNGSQYKDDKKSTSFITPELMSIEGMLFNIIVLILFFKTKYLNKYFIFL